MDLYQSKIKAELERNPFARTSAVHFEISNRCNLAAKHPNCPLGPQYQQEKLNAGSRLNYDRYLSLGTYLPMAPIDRALKELGKYNFLGSINFHRYNEPLIEPDKIKQLVKMARQYCTNASIIIYTNALTLTFESAMELVLAGTTKFIVSAYNLQMRALVENIFRKVTETHSKAEDELEIEIINFISKDDGDKWGNCALDDRNNLYHRAAKGETKESPYGPCRAPFNDITVCHTGEVVLCCLDWKNSVSFGSILTQRLSTIMRSEKAMKLYCELSKDIRNLPICKACGWSR